jgi:DNA-binding LacI/PurR family transcriptional regulator
MSSIQEVAKHAGVSTATVSRTFSTPDLLSHETRERVLQVADRLNYRPRRRASKTPAETPRSAEVSDCLGFLFFASDTDSNQINEFHASVLVGAQEEAARLGMHMIVRTLPRYEASFEMPRMSRESAVAGTLLVGAAPRHVINEFVDQLPAAILVDNQLPGIELDNVISDSFGGMLEATRYLIDLGHRKIGFVLNEPTAPSFRDRFRGYLCAHYDAGLTPNQKWILMAQRNQDVEPLLAGMLRDDDRPTAIVAANDMNAFTVMKACRDTGLSIPGDISLIGFDDMPFSIHAYPPLTTVAVDKQYLGRLAVRQLQRRIEEAGSADGRMDPPIEITVPVSLVKRGTCRDISQS